MSFLKVVIFGYPFFKFQGSKKLLGDTTLSRGWFLNNVLNAHPIHGRWNQHTSAETELEYTNLRKSWASQTDVVFLKQGYWEIFVVTSLGGGNSNMFLFPPRSWGKWSNLTSMVFRMQKCYGYQPSPGCCCVAIRLAPASGASAWHALGFFSWNANGEWTEVIADPPKKKTGLVTRLFSFLTNCLGIFFGRTSKKQPFVRGGLEFVVGFVLLEGWVDLASHFELWGLWA